MSEESQSKSKNRGGCILVFIVLMIIGYFKECLADINVGVEAFKGTWTEQGESYNPYSMGGVVSSGNYTVEYSLRISSDGTYELYHGSPGFLKLKRKGELTKSMKYGIILTGFDLGNRSDHDVFNVVTENGRVISFCTRSIGSVLDDCGLEFKR